MEKEDHLIVSKSNNVKDKDLQPEKLIKLLAKAEEFLAMIVEYDPVVERSRKVCLAIRFAFECYAQMNQKNLSSIADVFSIEAGNCSAATIVKEEDLDDLLGDESRLLPTKDVELIDGSNVKDNKIEEIYITEVKNRLNKELYEVQKEIDTDSTEYKIGLLNEAMEESEDIVQASTALSIVQTTTELESHEYSLSSLKNNISCYQCTLCNYTSPSKARIRMHISAVHYKFRPFKCHLCSYECSQKGVLKRHVSVVHDRVKPFNCPICKHEFSTREHVRSHVSAVHEKIRPFKCILCDYQSSRKRDLKRHVLTVHEKYKKFKCPMCDYASSEKRPLSNHILTEHNNLSV